MRNSSYWDFHHFETIAVCSQSSQTAMILRKSFIIMYYTLMCVSVCCDDVHVFVIIEQDRTVFSLTLIISAAQGQASFSRWKHVFAASVVVRCLFSEMCVIGGCQVHLHPQILSVTGLSWWWTKSFQWFISAEHQTFIRLH